MSRKKIVCLTAYDAPTAKLLEETGVDLILVGDSVGTVLLGHPSTKNVSLEEMIHHAKAARRGAPKGYIIGDLPLAAFRLAGGPFKAAVRFFLEGKLSAVKVEWNREAPELTRRLVKRGIPVMGHVGLTPQSVAPQAGFRVQGKTRERALEILSQAEVFEKSGASFLVLECVPEKIAQIITQKLSIPTIGIGSGRFCGGQVLVFHDVVGLTPGFEARFIRRFARLYDAEKKAVLAFARSVRTGKFPRARNAFKINAEEFSAFLERAGKR